jgi:hypothetical protein
LICDEERDGVYLVRFGYRKLMRERAERIRQRSGEGFERFKFHLRQNTYYGGFAKNALPTPGADK